MDSYAIGSRSIANRAMGEGRSVPGESPGNGVVYSGKVLALDNGLYRIATLDENGVALRIFDLVYAPMELSVNDKVTVRVDENDNPTVLSGGGGGGASCFQSYTEWGPFFG